MILIISSKDDLHTRTVEKELNLLKQDYQVVDLSEFPQDMQLKMNYSERNEQNFSLKLKNNTQINFEDQINIWWRRPQPFKIHSDISNQSYFNFAYGECTESFRGLWQSVDAFWINNPVNDDMAQRKPYQLKIAQNLGLNIPKTLITNDPMKTMEFVDSLGYGNVIYKSFSATMQAWRETRILKKEEMKLIENVKFAPVIFQQYIDAIYDLRITIIGDQIFPAAIYSQETAYQIDFRMDVNNARIEVVKLPLEIENKLFKFMKRLGLVYGAIDMRLTPDNEYVFFEINPAGQWLFIEQETKQPITKTLANKLSH